MKTLYVAVVVLSLTSVCRSASLACEKLLKPEDKSPDLSGSWYLIAMTSDTCLLTTLVNAIFWPSVTVDITSKDTPNVYDATIKIKMHGYCGNDSEPFFYEDNTIWEVDSNNAPTGKPDRLLQSGCPDCIVTKADDTISTFLFFSRRKAVTAAELKEFETQAQCLGCSKPQILNSDHDHENCKPTDDDADMSGFLNILYQRVKSMYAEPLECLASNIIDFPRKAYEWARKSVVDLW